MHPPDVLSLPAERPLLILSSSMASEARDAGSTGWQIATGVGVGLGAAAIGYYAWTCWSDQPRGVETHPSLVARKNRVKQIIYPEIVKHNTPDNLWVILQDQVYDVTGFIVQVPGAAEVFLKNAGKDATADFENLSLTANEMRLLHESLVGHVYAIPMSDVAKHCTKHDLWLVIDGKVYDLSIFADDHPGGPEALVESSGRDATDDFEDVGHSEFAMREMETYFIGNLAPPHILVVGPPGAGKGTMCNRMVHETTFSGLHIASGDIFRSEVAKSPPTKLGSICKRYMDAGGLIPDSIANDVVTNRLEEPDAEAAGWLLDGHPREKVNSVDMVEKGIRVDKIIVLCVPDDELVDRIVYRRTDPETGNVYNLKTNPPPTGVGERLTQRASDNEDTLRQRLKIYHTKTESCLSVFPDSIPRVFIDASKSLDEVYEQFKKAVLK